MEIAGYSSFKYLLLTVDQEIKEIDIVKQFLNCMSDLSELCSCQGEVIQIKQKECDSIYKEIVLNHINEIKDYLFEIDSNFTFKTGNFGEEVILATISKPE